jgi:hypothetical protein
MSKSKSKSKWLDCFLLVVTLVWYWFFLDKYQDVSIGDVKTIDAITFGMLAYNFKRTVTEVRNG